MGHHPAVIEAVIAFLIVLGIGVASGGLWLGYQLRRRRFRLRSELGTAVLSLGMSLAGPLLGAWLFFQAWVLYDDPLGLG